MSNLTNSLEDYLETIYVLSQNSKNVRITDIANKMGLSKASVNRAVNSLKSEMMLIQEKYGKISLTKQGEMLGSNIYTRHNILKKFFHEVLGVSLNNAESDACKSEHILSEETIQKVILYTRKYEN